MPPASEREERRRRFFDQAAEGWEERHYPPEIRARLEPFLARLATAPGLTILDAGCGRGILLPHLRRLGGRDARLIALDASAAMLRGVADKDPGAVALHARAESIPLIDAYVDRVLCFAAFPHFEDQAGAAREFHRVLKPGGLALVLHLASAKAVNRHHEDHPAVRGDRLPDEKTMRDLFLRVGFVRVSLEESADSYCFSAEKEGKR
ncbi:MAG: class I SAM-dependent methyltransferase [Desulfovibrio sp.]|jgi:ubiquinone/menaquinone biosynthesis C-methylase UbiE|nr:class I SAM-dependent methyltransferase [Desulfovibrio sp.]